MAAFARMQRRALRALGAPVDERSMLAIAYGGNAISVSLPSGGSSVGTAYTFRQLIARGVDPTLAAGALVVAGLFAWLAFGVVLLAGVALAGHAPAAGVAFTAAVVSAVPAFLLFVVLRRPAARDRLAGGFEHVSRAVPRVFRRTSLGSGVAPRPLIDRLAAIRLGGRASASLLSLGSIKWAADAVCLAAAVRATGASLPWHGWLLAYAVGIAAANVSLTPGGIGVIEGALAAALAAAGLAGPHALAAALVYRAVSFWLVVAAGWVVVFVLSRRTARHRATAPATGMGGAD